MLLQLNIKNFALIEELTISFQKGFNVFTGETGAGKSILIDAISYVLGGKFNRGLIRVGENKTYVEAVFIIENQNIINKLKTVGIKIDDMLIVSRETFQYGKSIAKLNGKSVLISKLKEIGSMLLDIHGQHENQNLLNNDVHIYYLDSFGEDSLIKVKDTYKEEYDKLIYIDKKINDLSGNESDREKLIDFLKYQVEEIDNAHLKEEEEKELESKFKELSNAEKINKVLTGAYSLLYGGIDGENSMYDSLGYIIKEMQSIKSIEKIKKIQDSLKDAYYIIEENIRSISDIKGNIYYDKEELDSINSRLFEIDGFKKKYGNSIEKVLIYRDKINNQYEEMVNSSEIIEKLKMQKENIINKLKDIGMKIHSIRCQWAEVLEKKIKKELDYVGLEKSTFKIKVDVTDKILKNGLDKVEFYISTNPGQPLKSLDKVVSGGELSRIMLALKTVFVDKDEVPSVIFDEIDTGISGRVAQSVGEKIYSISQNHQVFCVTHLSQIACMSDNHYYIYKEVNNNKTYTRVDKLNNNDKEKEIARLIGGSVVTDITLENSREIISMADKKKNNIKQIKNN